MIIDTVIDKIQRHTSIIDILLLQFLVFTSPVALYLMGKRISTIDYGRVGKRWGMNGRYVISAIIFSIPVIFGGLMIFFAGVAGEDDFGLALLMMVCGLCSLITGTLLLIYGIIYSNGVVKCSDALILYAKDTGRIDSKHDFSYGDVKMNAAKLRKYIDAFKKFSIVDFIDDQNGIYTVRSFHPFIDEYFAAQEVSEPPEIPFEVGKWTCQGCGAVNISNICEYCGRPKA